MSIIKMGDLVEPNDTVNSPLKKFGHTYINAIVYSTFPFVLINQNVNFLFEGQNQNDFKVIGVASIPVLIHIIYWQQEQIRKAKIEIKDVCPKCGGGQYGCKVCGGPE